MLQQQLGLVPGNMHDPFAGLQMPAPQQHPALGAGGLPDLPPAADLGTQLARLSSMRALASSGLSAEAAAAAVGSWPPAGGQGPSGGPPASMGM